MQQQKPSTFRVALLITVAALGYFVDIFDLVLFNVVKKESLLEIMAGASASEITQMGIQLFNMQMIGMLIGGIVWGILGDRKGRISVLFGSILLYSAANIANAFVKDTTSYAIIRIIAGLGLAGELGAGITLISETMHKKYRGLGTMVVVTFGALGVVAARYVNHYGEAIGTLLESMLDMPFANWKVCYVVGGAMGLVLLILRIGAFESGMFQNIKHAHISKGNFFSLFQQKKRFVKYISCILIGVPIWYAVGCLMVNSEEIFSKELHASGKILNADVLMFAYIGLSAGDFVSGLLSQVMKSRRKVVIIYLIMSFILMVKFLFFSQGISVQNYYLLSFLIGFGAGYWAIFVIIASEQFGTNIRSTVTNTVPNFVRGSVPIIMISFNALVAPTGNIWSAFIVGTVCILLALISVLRIPESFHKDLNYIEGEDSADESY